MNDILADETIESHKYLLEICENRAAIAYFAVLNRNQSLYEALRKHYKENYKNDQTYQDTKKGLNRKPSKLDISSDLH